MKQFIKTFIRDEAGVTLVEYGIALTLAITFGAAALLLLAGDVTGAVGAAATQMPG